MLLRFISTIVLAPVALAAIWFGSPYFDALVLLVGLIGFAEWCRVSKGSSASSRALWRLGGFLYIGLACVSLVILRADPDQGLALVVAFFSVIWATDIGAYLVGRSLRGPKLAPSISPNKTWSGAIGGTVCGALAGFLTASSMDLSYGNAALVGAGVVISVVSQFGDLFESWWKRRFQVKDSGSLIPGHGGILDRIDGVILASPVAVASHWVAHGGHIPWK